MTRIISAGSVSVALIEQDDSIALHLRRGKQFEPETLEQWASICRKGGVVVDVGCYTGLFSMVAAKQGCAVTAFEPMPRQFARCLQNFDLNDVEVDLRNACASEKSGRAELKFNPKVAFLTSGASLVRPSGGTGAPDECTPIDVDAVAIDDLALRQCTAIKIDVERGEPLVLRGARKTIDRCKPILVVEVLGEDEKQAVREAVPGYQVAAELDDRNWIMVPQ